MDVETPIEIAVFPLPEKVCFPGQSVDLHIFEPRYVQMVNDCIDHGRLLGIAIAQKVISSPPESSPHHPFRNLTTYEPRPIFGAGKVEITKSLPDGRLLIEVQIIDRFQLTETLQDIPYLLGKAIPLHDIPDPPSESSNYFTALWATCRHIFKERFVYFEKSIDKEAILLQDLTLLTFSVFQWVRLTPSLMQWALETTSPVSRAKLLIEAMAEFAKNESKPESEKGADVIKVDFRSNEH